MNRLTEAVIDTADLAWHIVREGFFWLVLVAFAVMALALGTARQANVDWQRSVNRCTEDEYIVREVVPAKSPDDLTCVHSGR